MLEVQQTPLLEAPQALPALECTPWCEDGDGHTSAWSLGDQYCVSDDTRVALTLEPMLRNPLTIDYLQVYVVQDRNERPKISLNRNELAGVYMTPAEAVELARVLTLYAKMAGQA